MEFLRPPKRFPKLFTQPLLIGHDGHVKALSEMVPIPLARVRIGQDEIVHPAGNEASCEAVKAAEVVPPDHVQTVIADGNDPEPPM